MARIFVSFRKSDERLLRDRVYRALLDGFGEAQVFKSGPSIRAGADYAQVLLHQAASCELMVVLIGPAWPGAADEEGTAHLHRVDDWVRREIATALAAGNRLVPVLLGDATMLMEPETLPPDIAQLGRLQFLRITDTEPDADIERLVSMLQWLQPELARDAPKQQADPGQGYAPGRRQGQAPQGPWTHPSEPPQGGQSVNVGGDLNAPGGKFIGGDDNSTTTTTTNTTVHRGGKGALGALAGLGVGLTGAVMLPSGANTSGIDSPGFHAAAGPASPENGGGPWADGSIWSESTGGSSSEPEDYGSDQASWADGSEADSFGQGLGHASSDTGDHGVY